MKKHWLTPLLFSEIFDLKIWAEIQRPKISEISEKPKYMVETFLYWGLKLVENSWKTVAY